MKKGILKNKKNIALCSAGVALFLGGFASFGIVFSKSEKLIDKKYAFLESYAKTEEFQIYIEDEIEKYHEELKNGMSISDYQSKIKQFANYPFIEKAMLEIGNKKYINELNQYNKEVDKQSITTLLPTIPLCLGVAAFGKGVKNIDEEQYKLNEI